MVKTVKKTSTKKRAPATKSKKTPISSSLPPIGKNAKETKGINIIRKDYLLETKVIFATARAKRPHDFTKPVEEKTSKDTCVFCPENQDKIILLEEEPTLKGDGWRFRSIKNLFGILTPHGKYTMPDLHCKSLACFERDAYGFAEVIIETPHHEKELEDLPKGSIAAWLSFLARRVTALRKKPGVGYVTIFKNRGRSAGASISHTHTQIITTPSVPNFVCEQKKICSDYFLKHGTSAFEKIIADERKSKRFVAENDYAICFTPFASLEPLELLIIPKSLHTCITTLTANDRKGIEELLLFALKRLKKIGSPPYNLLFVNDAPYGDVPFHLILRPRLNTPKAGFELLTGLSVNPTLPEVAAAFYKEEG